MMIPIDDNLIEILETLVETYGNDNVKKIKPVIPSVAKYFQDNIKNSSVSSDIDNLLINIENSISESINIILLMKNIDQDKISSEEINKSFKPLIIHILTPLKNHLEAENSTSLIEEINKISHTENIAKEIPNILEYILPKSRKILEQRDDRFLLSNLHPAIADDTKKKFLNSHYAEAVFSAIKCVEDILHNKHKENTGEEETGVSLVQKAIKSEYLNFVPDDLVVKDKTKKGIQKGFTQIFEGSMMGVRNFLAHEDVKIKKIEAIHYLFLCSLLLRKLENKI